MSGSSGAVVTADREAAGESRGAKAASSTLLPLPVFIAEVAGTALLLLGGLSLVILMWGEGSPMVSLIRDEAIRRAVTGFLFGTIGALIAISPVGARSGAHINPVVTLAFLLFRKLDVRAAAGYVMAQLSGAVLGCFPLLAWGALGRSVAFGATVPGAGYSIRTVFIGEVITTFIMITGLCLFLGFRHMRPFTPALFPPLYSLMVWAESPISGTSTNPARTLGPAVISGTWDGWWIYWAGPIIGTIAACLVCSLLAKRITVAKLYYFDSDRDRLFRRASRSQASIRGAS